METILENSATVALRNDKLRIQVNMGGHTIVADEPIESGGEATGPDPYELLSASLATCTMATLQQYLKRKDWDIKLVSVQVSFTEEDKNGSKTAHFHKQIKVEGDLDDTKINRLVLISDACPVSKILKSGNNTINAEVIY